MNKNYTLKELADIGAKAAYSCMPDGVRMCVLNGAPPHHVVARQAFTKAVLDAIGYEFPKDEEREAFERWQKSMLQGFGGDQYSFEKAAFEAWKAGREELRRAQLLDKQPAEPAWIPWEGGKCPLGDGMIWEAKFRSGTLVKGEGRACRWNHLGVDGDIVAYRVWEG